MAAQAELGRLVGEDAARRLDLVERGAGISTGEVIEQVLRRSLLPTLGPLKQRSLTRVCEF
ncbi:MAG: hypothetical protein WBB42_07590 [Polyangiales bacterium]